MNTGIENGPMISVIIPVYKVEEYLPKCLDSVLAQSYHNLEIILIDDGSPDRCGTICDLYAQRDARIKVIHQKNSGVSRARNVGLEQATGEYIGFVDSDDEITPDFYETLLSNALEFDTDISYCGIKLVMSDGTVEERFNTGKREIKQADEVIAGFFFNEEIKEHMYSQCNKIFKKEVLSGLRYREGYALGEDILFLFEALGNCHLLCLEDRTMYRYLRRENSAMTAAFSEKRMDYIAAAEEIVEMCEKKYPEVLQDAKQWIYQHKLVTCRQLICNPEYRKKYAKKFEELRCELKYGKRAHYARLNRKRKLDYFLVSYFPAGYALLKKAGRIR